VGKEVQQDRALVIPAKAGIQSFLKLVLRPLSPLICLETWIPAKTLPE
jgi:hypothetical protein